MPEESGLFWLCAKFARHEKVRAANSSDPLKAPLKRLLFDNNFFNIPVSFGRYFQQVHAVNNIIQLQNKAIGITCIALQEHVAIYT